MAASAIMEGHIDLKVSGSVTAPNKPTNFIIDGSPNDVSNYGRQGSDLIIQLKNGKTITIGSFFERGANYNNLVFSTGGDQRVVDFSDALTTANDGIADALVTISSIGASSSTSALLGILGGAAALGGIGAALGGDGGGDDDGATDTTAPIPAVINTLTGSEISGTAEPGSTIGVDINGDGVPDYTAIADADGNWSVNPSPALPEGTPISVVVTDPAGNTSTPVTGNADSTPPAPTVINTLTGSEISGTAEPGSTIGVDINDDGVPDYTAIADADGNWSVNPSPALPEGTPISVVVTDPAGNTSTPVTGNANSTPPAPTVINTLTGSEISGTAEPGSTIGVDINDDGVPDYTAIADADGNWSVNPSPALPEGTPISVVVTDPAGNTSTPVTGNADSTPPAPTVINTLTGSEISGTAEPGSTIGVDINDDGVPDYTAIADADGNWSVNPSPALPEGTPISVVVTDPAGNTSTPVTGNADSTPPAPTVINTLTGSEISGTAEPGSTIGVDINDDGVPDYTAIADADGNWSVNPSPALPEGTPISVVVTDPAGNTSTPVTGNANSTPPAPTVINTLTGSEISGTAEPGSTIGVDINEDGVPDYTAIADADGNWSVNPSPALPEGTPISVVVTDPAGNTSTPVTGNANSTPPAPTVINTLTGSEISGTAEPGSTIGVDINDDGVPDYTAIADADGNWSVNPSPALPEGTPISVVVTDPAGNTSTPVTGNADSTPPAPTVINTLTGSEISGTAEPGSTIGVDINDDGVPDYTAIADADGNWSVNPSPALPEGTPISVVVTDPAGNTSTPVTGNADSTPPAPTVINTLTGSEISGTAEPGSTIGVDINDDGVPDYTAIADADGNWSVNPSPALPEGTPISVVVTDPAGNTSTPVTGNADSTPPAPTVINTLTGSEISGTAEPGSTIGVDINDDGVPDYTAIADADGNWSVNPSPALPEGTPISVVVTDPAGNTSTPVTGNADSTPPAPTVINTLTGSEISGTAEPGSTIGVDINDDGVPDYTAIADADGNWSVNPSPALPEGTPISVVVTDPAGNTSTPVTGNADSTPPAPTVINTLTGSEISGTAEPGSTIGVDINDDGVPDYTAIADADGNWSVNPSPALPEGTPISVVVTDPAGNTSTPVTNIVDTTAPAQVVTIGDYTDNVAPYPGMSDVDLEGAFYPFSQSTNDTSPVINGTLSAALGAGEVVAIYRGGIRLGTASVDGTSWTYADTGLGNGAHQYTARVEDAAGNQGAVSAAQTLTVDATAPAQVVTIGDYRDNVAPYPGMSDVDLEGAFYPFSQSTNDTSPVINGTLSAALGAGEVVAIYRGGILLGTATVAGTSWTYADTGLGNGAHQYTARVEDAAGNQGAVSAVQTLTVDATAPAQVVTIGDYRDNVAPYPGMSDVDLEGAFYPFSQSTNDTSPVINGTLSAALGAGEVVAIYRGGIRLGTASVDGTSWTYADTGLGNGAHQYTARVEDAAGNQGAVSAAQTLTVDATAPAQVVTIGDYTDDVAPDTATHGFATPTNDTSPVINGTLSAALGAGEVVAIYRDTVRIGTATVAGTSWTYADTGLGNGAYQYTARVEDAAGNQGAVSAAQTLTVDATAPAQVVTIGDYTDDVAPDTATHGFATPTNDTSPVINGTLSAALGAGEVVAIYRGGIRLGTATVAGTSWTYADTGLTTGAYQYTARVEDAAGNQGAVSTAETLTVNTTQVAVSSFTLDMAGSSDTGTSSTDNVTGMSTPTVSGSITGLESTGGGTKSVTLFNDANNNNVLDSGERVFIANGSLSGQSGDVSFSFTLSLLQTGTYILKAMLLDGAAPTSIVGTLIGGTSNSTLTISGDEARIVQNVNDQADGLGYAISSAGDFNGDGIEDLIVTAPSNYKIFDGSRGSASVEQLQSDAWIIYGSENGVMRTGAASLSGLAATDGIRITYAGTTAGFNITGQTGAGLGDMNGDGYDDIVLSSNLGDSVVVVYGRAAGGTTIDASAIYNSANKSNSDGFAVAQGPDNNAAFFGASAGGGDVNNDGYADLLFGAPDASYAFNDAGENVGDGHGYIIYGHSGNITGAQVNNNNSLTKYGTDAAFRSTRIIPQWTDDGQGGNGAQLGEGVKSIGDVNGDGIDDFAISAPLYDGSGSDYDVGRVYVFFGKTSAAPTNTDIQNAVKGVDYVNFLGLFKYQRLGGSIHSYNDMAYNETPDASRGGIWGRQSDTISSVGDVNGDGFGDFVIGNPDYNGGAQYIAGYLTEGRAYLVYGRSASAWQSIGSSTDFVLNASGIAGVSSVFMMNNSQKAGFGNGVRGLGDVNGDGLDDFLIGAPGGDVTGADSTGAVYLVYGKVGGFGTSSVDLDNLVTAGGAKKYTGAAALDLAGTNVAIGDWNGDGLSDFAFGSPGANVGAFQNAGKFQVYYGSVDKLTHGFTVFHDTIIAGQTTPGAAAIVGGVDRLAGGAGNDTFTGVGAMSDTGNAGLFDVAYGGSGNDTIGVVGTNFTKLDGGLGIDRLKIETTSALTLDFNALSQKVKGFEEFDLGVAADALNGNHTLALRLSDVLNLAGDQSGTTFAPMKILGDSGDRVDIDTVKYTTSSTQTVGSTTYNVYHNADIPVANKFGDIWIQSGILVI